MCFYKFNKFPILKSDKLILRELSISDADAIFNIRTNREINKLIKRETFKNIEDAKEFIEVCHQEFLKENRIFWGIEFNNILIGSIVYHRISIKDNYAEIGYELNPDYQQKGIMSEAMETVLTFGKENMNLKTIEAYTHKNNTASFALLKKYNFVYQPERKCAVHDFNTIWKLEVRS